MKSDRITLINCDEELLNLILSGNDRLSKVTGLLIPDEWSEFGIEIFNYTLQQIKGSPSKVKWYSYLPIENKTNTLIGSCGYKGEPNNEGVVEIGYEVAKDFRNQGYATEITELLINEAFKHNEVKKIQAHTLAEKNASVRVLEKCNFKFMEEIVDEEDGRIWKWMKEK